MLKNLGVFQLSSEEKSFEKDGDKVEWTELTISVKGYPIKIVVKKEDKKLFDMIMNGEIPPRRK